MKVVDKMRTILMRKNLLYTAWSTEVIRLFLLSSSTFIRICSPVANLPLVDSKDEMSRQPCLVYNLPPIATP